MSTAIAGKKLSTKPAEPDDRQRARQSKRHPDCRSTTIKLTAHANIACVIVGPRQSSSRRDRRNGHPDCRCVPIQIVALQYIVSGLEDRTSAAEFNLRASNMAAALQNGVNEYFRKMSPLRAMFESTSG